MRILYISQTSHLYGSGRALYNILCGIQRIEGIDVVVVLPNDQGELYKSLKERGLEPIIIPIPSCVYPPRKSFRDKIAFVYRLVRVLRESRHAFNALCKVVEETHPNIIHTNVGVIHVGYRAARMYHIPHVWHIREFQDLHFGWTPIPSNSLFKKKLHSEGNYCISISRALYEHYNLGTNACVVYDGVFDETLIPEQIISKKNYFLYVGNISEGKGVREAVTGYMTFSKRNPEFEFWLAGEGELIPWLLEQTKIEPSIKVLGYRKDINELMQGAIALIVPSRYEGFGFISVEAMLNHCIVIGHNVAGIKEQFDNGLEMTGKEIGLRYEGEEELVAAMNYVIEPGSASELQEMIERAHNTVLSLYSIQKDTKELLELYKKLLNK